MKVMFSAIITAMLGLFWAGRFGWLDLSRLALPPTDLQPQLIGAVIFGAGFAIASLCPGTACVAAGTGRRDGLATIAGLFAGTLVTAELWPLLGRVAENRLRADATLPHDLGLSSGVTVALLVLIAFGALGVGGYIERRVGTERNPVRHSAHVVLTTIAAVLALFAAVPLGADEAPRTGSSVSDVAPLDLARWIHDRRAGLRVIEVSDQVDTMLYQIPGAIHLASTDVDTLSFSPDETIVLYSKATTLSSDALTRLQRRGAIGARQLRGGLSAWEQEVLSPVIPPATDSAGNADFARIRSLSNYFGGRPVAQRIPGEGRRQRRRNTC